MNTSEIEVANVAKPAEPNFPKLVIEYNPEVRAFRVQMHGDIPSNELVGAMEIFKQQIIANQLLAQNMAQMQAEQRKVQVAGAVPPTKPNLFRR